MVVVAVAGGTGAVGRNIVEALIAQGKHEVIILSRTVSMPLLIQLPITELTSSKANAAKEKEIGARLVATDYKDVAALTKSSRTTSPYCYLYLGHDAQRSWAFGADPFPGCRCFQNDQEIGS